MIYLFESKIPDDKSVFFALTHVYGINKYNSFLVCKKLGLSQNFKIKNLTKDQIDKLIKLVEASEITLGSSLKKFEQLTAKNLISVKSYRGLRKNQGLPVRGQRTHTNAKTSRKNRF